MKAFQLAEHPFEAAKVALDTLFTLFVPTVTSKEADLLLEKHTYHVSKVFNAPLNFVYDWLTDYREDDNQITASKTQFKILQKTKRRVIYLSTLEREGKTVSAVKIVTLYPPKAWHLDYVGEEEDAIGLYKLTRLGPEKTRLYMTFKEKYKISDAPTKEEDRNHTDQMWDKYVATLEKDYASDH